MATGSILVVDDEYGVRSGIRAILEMDGYDVEDAADGAAALAQIERRDFDVALLDYRLPDTDGLSLHATGLRFQCTAAFPAETATTALLASFSAHKMAPPRGWPVPPYDCSAFNCTCKGMADWFGVGAGGTGTWGCAPSDAQEWWVHEARPCEQPGYSCCAATDYTKKQAPFPGCQ